MKTSLKKRIIPAAQAVAGAIAALFALAALNLTMAMLAPAHAAELPGLTMPHLAPMEIDVTAASYHLTSYARHQYSQDNPGIGIDQPLLGDDASMMFGAYRNSERRTSFYYALDYTPWSVAWAGADLRAGVMGGLVSGYTRHKVSPGVGLIPKTRFPALDGAGFNLIVVPNQTPRMRELIGIPPGSGFVGLQLAIPLAAG